jgi:glutaredoxin
MDDHAVESVTAVRVYWRPRCQYCIKLRWRLHRTRLPLEEVNIWRDASGAARVREITGGDETVPTVVIGEQALVNPTIEQIVTALRTEAPHLVDHAITPNVRPAYWILAPLLVAIVWGVLAFWHPTVTYHLAPALTAAAAPAFRRLNEGPLALRAAAGGALVGLAVALAATVVLAHWHALMGPTVTGGHNVVGETLLLAGVGAVVSAWVVTLRRSRTANRS